MPTARGRARITGLPSSRLSEPRGGRAPSIGAPVRAGTGATDRCRPRLAGRHLDANGRDARQLGIAVDSTSVGGIGDDMSGWSQGDATGAPERAGSTEPTRDAGDEGGPRLAARHLGPFVTTASTGVRVPVDAVALLLALGGPGVSRAV